MLYTDKQHTAVSHVAAWARSLLHIQALERGATMHVVDEYSTVHMCVRLALLHGQQGRGECLAFLLKE